MTPIPSVLRAAACAIAILLGAPVSGWAQAVAPAPAPGTSASQDDLQPEIAKSNAYTALMNRTLRAIQSWERYASWVNMQKGPTGKERYISYGLYSLYDVTGEIKRAEEAAARPPALRDLDQTIGRYIRAYQDLAPLITRAERYYDRMDYRGDNLAEGQKLHALLVPAAKTFLGERAILDAQMRVYKKALDARELAAVERSEGRSARWQVRNIMINARAIMDLMPSNEAPIVDLKVFNAAIVDYAAAVREMDIFKDKNPAGVPFIESQAGSWLGKLREFSDKLARAKGDVRRGAANDANSLVSSYNTMVSLSETAIRTSR